MMINFYFDGSTKLNSVCIYSENEKINKINSFENVLTNNQLEYYGLILALRSINSMYKNEDVIIYGDSQLVIDQMNGLKKIVNEKLKVLNAQAKLELDYSKYVHKNTLLFKWVPRLENKAGIILDEKMKKC